MRIIGGKHRGRVFNPPKGLPVRPTTDQAKEGLFNILSHRFNLSGINALELFAGTGNVSYELWSRGAATVTAVDQYPGCCRFISQTFQALGCNGEVVCSTAEKFVGTAKGPFDVVFMDPPYAYTGVPDLIEKIMESELLAQDAIVIVEHASATQFGGLRYFFESRKYGSSSFSFFRKPNP